MIQTCLFIPPPPRAPPNTLHRACRIDFQGIFVILFRFLGDQGRGISLPRTKCCEYWHTPVLCIGWVQMQRIFSACRCSLGCQEHTSVSHPVVFHINQQGFFYQFLFPFYSHYYSTMHERLGGFFCCFTQFQFKEQYYTQLLDIRMCASNMCLHANEPTVLDFQQHFLMLMNKLMNYYIFR